MEEVDSRSVLFYFFLSVAPRMPSLIHREGNLKNSFITVNRSSTISSCGSGRRLWSSSPSSATALHPEGSEEGEEEIVIGLKFNMALGVDFPVYAR